MLPPFANPQVERVFAAYSDAVRPRLLDLRAFILDEAAATEGVGDLEESLKWGQPSYRPKKPRIGTTLRIDEITGTPARCGLFVHCQTSLIAPSTGNSTARH